MGKNKTKMRDERVPLRIIRTNGKNNTANIRRAIQACNVQETVGNQR